MVENKEKPDVFLSVYPNLVKRFDEMTDKALLDIWVTNDQQAYSPLAFKAVEEILYKRNIQPPLQDEYRKPDPYAAHDYSRRLTFLLTLMISFSGSIIGAVVYSRDQYIEALLSFMAALLALTVWARIYWATVFMMTIAVMVGFFYSFPPFADFFNQGLDAFFHPSP